MRGHCDPGGLASVRPELPVPSLAGVAFYRAHGFVEIARCDAPLRNGAAIPCVVMRKDLTGAAAAE